MDHGESSDRVLEALAILEQFITWWQDTHHQAWDPQRWTRADDIAYRATLNSSNSTTYEYSASSERVQARLNQFRTWLIDQGVVSGKR